MSNKLNLLVAYPYCKADVVEKIAENQESMDFLLDSGAFTAWKLGKPIQLEDYCRFIETLPIKPWRYFALDVIGNAKASEENYLRMLDRGLRPIPIFTRGESPAMLEKYYETSDVVGIGGLVGTQGNAGFVKGIMKIVGKRKVHWLGFNKKEFIAHYRPYMCDSSSWSGAIRYGQLSIYDKRGRFIRIQKSDFTKAPSQELIRIIDEYGLDIRDFGKTEQWTNRAPATMLFKATCRSWTKYQADLEKTLGTKFFLACGNKRDVVYMTEGYKHWRQK